MSYRLPWDLPLLSLIAGGVAAGSLLVILGMMIMEGTEHSSMVGEVPQPQPPWVENLPEPLDEVPHVSPPPAEPVTPVQVHAQAIPAPSPREEPEAELEPSPVPSHNEEWSPEFELSHPEIARLEERRAMVTLQYEDFLIVADLPPDMETEAYRLLYEHGEDIQRILLAAEYHGFDREEGAGRIRALDAELNANMERLLPWRVRPDWEVAWNNRTENFLGGIVGSLMPHLLSPEGVRVAYPVLVEELTRAVPEPAEQILFSEPEISQRSKAAFQTAFERLENQLSSEDYERFHAFIENNLD